MLEFIFQQEKVLRAYCSPTHGDKLLNNVGLMYCLVISQFCVFLIDQETLKETGMNNNYKLLEEGKDNNYKNWKKEKKMPL